MIWKEDIRKHSDFDLCRTYAVGVPSLRQSGILHFYVCGFSRYARKNRTQPIGTYYAAAGKKCGFEMRNNATAQLLIMVYSFRPAGEKEYTTIVKMP